MVRIEKRSTRQLTLAARRGLARQGAELYIARRCFLPPTKLSKTRLPRSSELQNAATPLVTRAIRSTKLTRPR